MQATQHDVHVLGRIVVAHSRTALQRRESVRQAFAGRLMAGRAIGSDQRRTPDCIVSRSCCRR